MAQRAAAQDRAAQRAMMRIARVARKHNNWALVSLAVRARLDAFTKVKKAIARVRGARLRPIRGTLTPERPQIDPNRSRI